MGTIAVHTLPITSTMWNVGPFLIVMAVYLFASVNLFYALCNNYGLEDCFILIYKLVVLGDLDLEELEHKTEQPGTTQYFHVVRIMVVGLSFLIGVTMMNLFIAVLCKAYGDAVTTVQLTFMESRTSNILDQRAIRKGVKHVKTCLCRRRNRIKEERDRLSSVEEEQELECERVSSHTSQEVTQLAHRMSQEGPRDISHSMTLSRQNMGLTAAAVLEDDDSCPFFLWLSQPTLSPDD